MFNMPAHYQEPDSDVTSEDSNYDYEQEVEAVELNRKSSNTYF